MNDLLILVNENDEETGYEEKEPCHLLPVKLHRAFSIFVFDSAGKMLLHKRSVSKKTWPGYWTNACCSHPRKGESLEDAVMRRLREELDIQTPLTHLFTFTYAAEYDLQYGENEIDHVFLGFYDGKISPAPDEIEDCRFVDPGDLNTECRDHPERFTPWFLKALPEVLRRFDDRAVSGTAKGIDTGL